jgi:hypothetical protein
MEPKRKNLIFLWGIFGSYDFFKEGPGGTSCSWPVGEEFTIRRSITAEKRRQTRTAGCVLVTKRFCSVAVPARRLQVKLLLISFEY